MEATTAAMEFGYPCALCGNGALSFCAHGRSAHALLALLDTIAMVSIFVVRLADALGLKALGLKALAIILARTGRAVPATRRPLSSCSMG